MKIARRTLSLILTGGLLLTSCTSALAMNNDRYKLTLMGSTKGKITMFQGQEADDNIWDNEFIGEDPTVKFYPDAYANYWRYGLKRTEDSKNVGLKVSGVFPDARYMSFNVYDDTNFSPINSMTDYNIIPDVGSVNPYASSNGDTSGLDQEYTIYVVPEGTDNITGDNVIYYDDSLDRIAIILRYYLPYQDAKGGVPLPTIEAFDTQTGEPTELPEKLDLGGSPRISSVISSIGNSVISGIVRPLFLLNRGEELHAYHLSGNGMYPNKDNNYLVMPMKRNDDEVAVIKFKAPTLSRDGEGDVRYFSIGQGDDESHNLITYNDEDLVVADDGYVYLVISDKELNVVTDKSYNYMPWKTDSNMVLIYRNLLTSSDYEGSMELVPDFKEDRSAVADAYIGDYAPIGKLVTISDFEANGFDCIK